MSAAWGRSDARLPLVLPPLVLALSVHQAVTDAIASLNREAGLPQLDAPATPECVLAAVDAARAGTTP